MFTFTCMNLEYMKVSLLKLVTKKKNIYIYSKKDNLDKDKAIYSHEKKLEIGL